MCLFGIIQLTFVGIGEFVASCIALKNFSLIAFLINTFLTVLVIYVFSTVGRGIYPNEWDHGTSGHVHFKDMHSSIIVTHSDLLISIKVFIIILSWTNPRFLIGWCGNVLLAVPAESSTSCRCHYVSCPVICLNTGQRWYLHPILEIFVMYMCGRPLA